MLRAAVMLALVVATARCGGAECAQPPCPQPVALSLTVAAADTGAPVTNATVTVSGAVSTTVACAGSCSILGEGGTYQLTVRAPGFKEFQRDVSVTGHRAACGCATVDRQNVTASLVSGP